MLCPTVSATAFMVAAASFKGYLLQQSALIALAPCARVVPQSPSPTLKQPACLDGFVLGGGLYGRCLFLSSKQPSRSPDKPEMCSNNGIDCTRQFVHMPVLEDGMQLANL